MTTGGSRHVMTTSGLPEEFQQEEVVMTSRPVGQEGRCSLVVSRKCSWVGYAVLK